MPIMVRGDYIIGTERRDFYNFCIREPRGSTDYLIILAELKGGGVTINHKYFKGRTTWTIVAPKGVPMQEENEIFNDLRKEVNKTVRSEWEKVTWI